MVRGDIRFVDLEPRSGSELQGRRPCILVSIDSFTASAKWHSVTVVPLTSSPRWLEEAPTTVLFEAGECGLVKRCVALAQQVTTVDKSKVKGGPIGRLTPDKEAQLAEALRNYLSL